MQYLLVSGSFVVVAVWQHLTAANRYLDDVAREAGRRLPVLALTPGARH